MYLVPILSNNYRKENVQDNQVPNHASSIFLINQGPFGKLVSAYIRKTFQVVTLTLEATNCTMEMHPWIVHINEVMRTLVNKVDSS